MPHKVRLRARAEADLAKALAYYDAIGRDLGDAFLAEYRETERQIAENPGRWYFIQPPVRCGRINRFPYYLAYEEEDDTVIVYRVMHNRQKRPKSFRRGSK